MTSNRPYRFIISGGGTGGHIFPALAVAQEIRKRHEDAEILFVGARGKMEMTRVPEAGFEITGLWISGLQRRLTVKNLMFPFKVIHSWLAAKKIIRNFKPDAVLGFGGYASGPTMLAATGKGITSLIQEQNSYAGMTNKRVGTRVNRICVAYDNMERYFPVEKIVLTGNPVRTDILRITEKREQAFGHYHLTNGKPVLLVIGGSLGARTINNSMIAGLTELENSGMQILWQTGKIYYEEMKRKADEKGTKNIHVLEFIREMDLAYAAADVIISRAGALSISELCIVGKPVILVPSANVAEDHQTKNARTLQDRNAAWMVTDAAADTELISTVIRLINDETSREALSENIKTLAKPRATEAIVNELEMLIA